MLQKSRWEETPELAASRGLSPWLGVLPAHRLPSLKKVIHLSLLPKRRLLAFETRYSCLQFVRSVQLFLMEV